MPGSSVSDCHMCHMRNHHPEDLLKSNPRRSKHHYQKNSAPRRNRSYLHGGIHGGYNSEIEDTFVRRSNSSSAMGRYNHHSHHQKMRGRSRSFTDHDREVSIVPEGTELHSYRNELRPSGSLRTLEGASLEDRVTSFARVSGSLNSPLNSQPDLLVNAASSPNSRVGTLTTNPSPASIGQDNSHDYYLHVQRQRYKEDKTKHRFNLQTVMLIGCYALLVVVAIIVAVVVCYQNGWLGFGSSQVEKSSSDDNVRIIPSNELDKSHNINRENKLNNKNNRNSDIIGRDSENIDIRNNLDNNNNNREDSRIRDQGNANINQDNKEVAFGGFFPIPSVPSSGSGRDIFTHQQKNSGRKRIHVVENLSQLEELRDRLLKNHAINNRPQNNDHIVSNSDINLRDLSFPQSNQGVLNVEPTHSRKGTSTNSRAPISPQNIPKESIFVPHSTKNIENVQFTHSLQDDIVTSKQDHKINEHLIPFIRPSGRPIDHDKKSNINAETSISSHLNPTNIEDLLSTSISDSILPEDTSSLSTQELLDLLAIRRMRDLLNSRGNSDRILEILQNVKPSENVNLENFKVEHTNWENKNERKKEGRKLDIFMPPALNSGQLERKKNFNITIFEKNNKLNLSTPLITNNAQNVSNIRHIFINHKNLSDISKRRHIQPINLKDLNTNNSFSTISSLINNTMSGAILHILNNSIRRGNLDPTNVRNVPLHSKNVNFRNTTVSNNNKNIKNSEILRRLIHLNNEREKILKRINERLLNQAKRNSSLSSKENIQVDKPEVRPKDLLTEQLIERAGKPTKEPNFIVNFDQSKISEQNLQPKTTQFNTIQMQDQSVSHDSPIKQLIEIFGHPINESNVKVNFEQRPIIENNHQNLLHKVNHSNAIKIQGELQVSPNDLQTKQLNERAGKPTKEQDFIVNFDHTKISQDGDKNLHPRITITHLNSSQTQDKSQNLNNLKIKQLIEIFEKPTNKSNVVNFEQHKISEDGDQNLQPNHSQFNSLQTQDVSHSPNDSQIKQLIEIARKRINESSLRANLKPLTIIDNQQNLHPIVNQFNPLQIQDELQLNLKDLQTKQLFERVEKESKFKDDMKPITIIQSHQNLRPKVAQSESLQIDVDKSEITSKDLQTKELIERTRKPSKESNIKVNEHRIIVDDQNLKHIVTNLSQIPRQILIADTLPSKKPDPSFAVHIQSGGRGSLAKTLKPSGIFSLTPKRVNTVLKQSNKPVRETVAVQPGSQFRNSEIIRSWTHKDSKGIFTKGQVHSDGSFAFTNCRPAEVCDENKGNIKS